MNNLNIISKSYLPILISCTLVFTGLDYSYGQQKDSLYEYKLDEVVISDTREVQNKKSISATIDQINSKEIELIKPTHPSGIMGLVPGVWVNVTGGEGHMTSIRQPLTTNPVYLYLEDGIPARSTGFFNHNALYEINLPSASAIEITKGPGSALYGSDAIGGIVNVMTKSPKAYNGLNASVEAGSYGWIRGLLEGNLDIAGERILASFNGTKTKGWRDATDYERYTGSLRFDHNIGNRGLLKTIISFSKIDQNTAGSSAILKEDYLNNPTINYTPISFRKVDAFRISVDYENEFGNSLLSIIPYFRYNSMDILPNWSLTYDPTFYSTKNNSYGMLAKYRIDFPGIQTRVITGIDFDYSPGSKYENKINPVKEGKIFSSFTDGDIIYDYDVTFQEAAPYIQVENSMLENLFVNAGVRIDYAAYNYNTKLPPLETGNWKVPSNKDITYTHLSPKVGISYSFSNSFNTFLSYRHGFRVPSEGQLFRQGSAINTTGLEPVKVNSYEAGIRGTTGELINYEISAYYMIKRDDILSFRNPVTGFIEALNAGETSHKGIETGVTINILKELSFDAAYSYAVHKYETWIVNGVAEYSGFEMETAPREIGNFSLNYNSSLIFLSIEFVRLGDYWMDPANTVKYPGHILFNFRFNIPFRNSFELYGSLFNINDKKFAESASYTPQRGEEYAPGLPRSFTLGLNYKLN